MGAFRVSRLRDCVEEGRMGFYGSAYGNSRDWWEFVGIEASNALEANHFLWITWWISLKFGTISGFSGNSWFSRRGVQIYLYVVCLFAIVSICGKFSVTPRYYILFS